MAPERPSESPAQKIANAILPHWHVIRLLPSVSPTLTAAAVLGIALTAALPVASTLAAGTLVGLIPPAVAAGPSSPDTRAAFTTLGLVGALVIAARAVALLRATVARLLGRRLDERLRERVMLALNRPVGISHLEDPALRDQIERAQGIMSGITAGSTVGPSPPRPLSGSRAPAPPSSSPVSARRSPSCSSSSAPSPPTTSASSTSAPSRPARTSSSTGGAPTTCATSPSSPVPAKKSPLGHARLAQ